jgi:hypothetical protein
MARLDLGDGAVTGRRAHIEDRNLDEIFTAAHSLGKPAEQLFLYTEEFCQDANVAGFELARAPALQELLDVGRVATEQPGERRILDPALGGQAFQFDAGMIGHDVTRLSLWEIS